MQFTFSPESGNDILFFEGLNNVPVQRNWRTNILGKILTGDINFNITIDPIYDGEYNNTDNYQGNKVGLNGTYYETIKDALAVANDGDAIYVGEDTYTSLPSITKKVTLICEEGTVFEGKQGFDIAGSTIVGATFQSGSDELVSYYSTINGTFKDCTFNGDLKFSEAGETVVFENCEFNGPNYALHFDQGINGSKVILKNCVINSDWRVAIGAAVSMFEATDCKFNVDGFINMWGKAKLTNCEFKKPYHWICSMDYTEYTNCMYDGRALTADDIRIEDTVIKVNGEYYASTVDGLNTAINNGATTINLTKGNYVIPSSAQGKTLTIIGTGTPEDVKVEVTKVGTGGENCDYGLDGSTVTFEGITITTNSSTYIGYARCKGTYKNCVINGTYTLYGDSKFENCTFNVSGDVYNIWTWGAPNATFDKCTFNSDGKALLLYQEGTNTVNLTVKSCIFNDNGGLTSKKAAIEIGDAPYGATPTYNVTVSGTTVNGYEINNEGINTGTTLWGNKNSMPAERLNVTVDGTVVY